MQEEFRKKTGYYGIALLPCPVSRPVSGCFVLVMAYWRSCCYNHHTGQITTNTRRDVRLPASVQEIAEVIGSERALYLIGQLPRCYVDKPGHKSWRVILYVPKTLKPDHPLVVMIGWHDAMRLVKAFGGEILQPASCADIYRRFRDQSAIRMAGEGMKPAAIAELLGVSDRHVRNLLRDGGEKTQEANHAENSNHPALIHLHKRASPIAPRPKNGIPAQAAC